MYTRRDVVSVLTLVVAAPGGHLLAQGKLPPPRPPTVTSVSAAVDQPSSQGTCPAKLTFAGTIITAAVPRAPVTYQWVRSDGTKGPKRTLKMTTTAAVVTDVWAVGTSGEMMRVWQELRVLTPNQVKSNQAVASVLCH